MTIGHVTLRIAQWIVVGVAAVNVAVSITDGKVGLIPNIVISAVCYLLLIELVRFIYRAVRFWFETFRGLNQNAGTVVRHQHRGACPDLSTEDVPFSKPMFNPTTGWPMVGICDADGHFYGESEHN